MRSAGSVTTAVGRGTLVSGLSGTAVQRAGRQRFAERHSEPQLPSGYPDEGDPNGTVTVTDHGASQTSATLGTGNVYGLLMLAATSSPPGGAPAGARGPGRRKAPMHCALEPQRRSRLKDDTLGVLQPFSLNGPAIPIPSEGGD